MVPFGNTLYNGGRPSFGTVGPIPPSASLASLSGRPHAPLPYCSHAACPSSLPPRSRPGLSRVAPLGNHQVGFTPRNFLQLDHLIAATLKQFGGDPERVSLTSTSYGGRGLYWYQASRPNVLASLSPMAASIGPTPALTKGACCESGEPSCCPAVWHVVGANDHASMVNYHDKWDAAHRAQTQRKTEVIPPALPASLWPWF